MSEKMGGLAPIGILEYWSNGIMGQLNSIIRRKNEYREF
jgi:hypothetical protein